MKHTSTIALLAISLMAMATTACRDDEPELLRADEMMIYSKPSEQFDAVWRGINQNYVFWDVDSTDWDAVYAEYMPRFRALDERESVSSDELKELYKGATATLLDHHMSIMVCNLWGEGNERNQKIYVSPADNELKQRPYYHRFDTYGVWEAEDHLISDLNISDYKSGEHGGTYYCTAVIDDHVLYFGFTNFMITELMNDATAPEPQLDDYWDEDQYESDHNAWLAVQQAKDVVDTYITNALDNPAITDVIIDLRSNTGGYLADEYYVLGLFMDGPTLAGYTRHKSGIGRYDYSPWIPHTFYPYERTRLLSGKIVVLCDLYSVSMAEITSLLAKEMPNAVLMGERTYGGHGVLYGDFNEYYTGTFGSMDGPHYGYLCDRCTRTTDGTILEGQGVTPDITLTYDYNDVYGGTNDTWLDRALEYIATGH